MNTQIMQSSSNGVRIDLRDVTKHTERAQEYKKLVALCWQEKV